ncbi:amidase [Bacillus sp. 31A1R]|uniref:Amidase n=1 Tax=Robertmurraya mangrovi TaxID=3098077 RepID=A0ABU5J3Q5_9BACI|nr:amidase [Bacillus sp. 31A1R]MDZ5474033.1 amidase [Bacillus sp. 31A1R]
MNSRINKLSLIFLLGLGLMLSTIPSKAEANVRAPLSTWLWDTAKIQTKGDEILSFLEKQNVKQVYLQVNSQIPVSAYKQFISKASRKYIKVHALDGAPDWVSPNGGQHLKSMFDWLRAYQRQALPQERFSGVHLDVEPYLHSSWNSDYDNSVLAYQKMLSNAKVYSGQLKLPLGADIPFWFDEKMYNNSYGKGDLASWVIRNVHYISIMAYRDQAVGPNGIIELVKNEVNLANKLGKAIIIGVETGQSYEAQYVSFYEEGQAYMFNQLQLVQSAYSKVRNVSFAIHYVDSWMAMKQ